MATMLMALDELWWQLKALMTTRLADLIGLRKLMTTRAFCRIMLVDLVYLFFLSQRPRLPCMSWLPASLPLPFSLLSVPS